MSSRFCFFRASRSREKWLQLSYVIYMSLIFHIIDLVSSGTAESRDTIPGAVCLRLCLCHQGGRLVRNRGKRSQNMEVPILFETRLYKKIHIEEQTTMSLRSDLLERGGGSLLFVWLYMMLRYSVFGQAILHGEDSRLLCSILPCWNVVYGWLSVGIPFWEIKGAASREMTFVIGSSVLYRLWLNNVVLLSFKSREEIVCSLFVDNDKLCIHCCYTRGPRQRCSRLFTHYSVIHDVLKQRYYCSNYN